MALQRIYFDENADGVRVIELSPTALIPAFLTPSRWPGMVQIFFFGIVGGLMLWLIGLPLGFEGFPPFLTGFVAGIFYVMVKAQKRADSQNAAARACFVRRGFEVDFGLTGLLIDSKARKIAFYDLKDAFIDLYDFSDLLSWEVRWKSEQSSTFSPITKKTHVSSREIAHVLVVDVRNATTPRYAAHLPNRAAGETWIARLNALVNG